MELRITTLIEDMEDNTGDLIHEHGLSLYIEFEGKKILFDTGQTGKFVENAAKLGKSLEDVDEMMISHGHYDHSGGVRSALSMIRPGTELCLGERFFEEKYVEKEDGGYRFAGNSFTCKELEEKGIRVRTIRDDVTYITDHILLFKNFKAYTSYEKIPSFFVLKDGSTYMKDAFTDEIVLGLKTSKGLVVIVGCSHIGIVNILRTISERVNEPIYCVIGGTHLVGAEPERIEETVQALKAMHIEKIAVSHCTGPEGMEAIKAAFKQNYIRNNTGNIIEME